MSFLRNITSGLRSLFRKEQVDRELDEEFGAYLEMAAEVKIKQGMSRKDAIRAVCLERGSLEVSKEIVRSGSWEFFLETCWQDLRYGLRALRRPEFHWEHIQARKIGAKGARDTLVISAKESNHYNLAWEHENEQLSQ